MILIVRVIPITIENMFILPGFSIFDLNENMLNNTIINFF
jgi:hypothetical protein